MVDILFSRPQPLRVHNDHVDNFVILIVGNEWFSPDPNTLGFGVGRRPDCKALIGVEDDLVEKEGLACAVDACDGDDGDFALEGVEEC